MTSSEHTANAVRQAERAFDIARVAAPIAGILGGGAAGAGGGLAGVVAGAGAGFAAGRAHGDDAGKFLKQAVLLAYGEHEMKCTRCHVNYSTTKQFGEEGYGLCIGCRGQPGTLAMPWKSSPLSNINLAVGTRVSARSSSGQWFDAQVLSHEPDGGVTIKYLHAEGRQKKVPRDHIPYILRSAASMPTKGFNVGQPVHVFSQTFGQWVQGTILSVDSQGNVAVGYENGMQKIVPHDQVPQLIR